VKLSRLITENKNKHVGHNNVAICHDKSLHELPPDLPTEVTGYFSCANNALTTMKNCPLKVESLYCNDNRLTSLEYIPKIINGNLSVAGNAISTFEHFPTEVHGNFNLTHNKTITSLQGIQKYLRHVDSYIEFKGCPIKSHILGLLLIYIGGDIVIFGNPADKSYIVDTIMNRWKNQGRKGILGAQRELIAAGYKELAQL
jgi:hypothetical protein